MTARTRKDHPHVNRHRLVATALVLSCGVLGQAGIAIADDEGTTNDSTTGANILALFRELSEQGRTIVLVTHDNEIAANAPRRIVIKDGKMLNAPDHFHDKQPAANGTS